MILWLRPWKHQTNDYPITSEVRLCSALCRLSHLLTCRIGDLRDKLHQNNLTNVSFIIVNEREAHSRAMYWALKRSAPDGVRVYQQEPFQSDVWEALDGDKDDFLIYDRWAEPAFQDIYITFRFYSGQNSEADTCASILSSSFPHRCGLLTFHLVMPYSFLHFRYVEAAVTATYLKDICNCTVSNHRVAVNSSTAEFECVV